MFTKRQYHTMSVESVIADAYARGKGYLFEMFFGWRSTNENSIATYLFSKRDWEKIDVLVDDYKRHVKQEGKMDVTVLISVTREEMEEYNREYEECNGERLTDEEILESFIEYFYADASEYVHDGEVQTEIIE